MQKLLFDRKTYISYNIVIIESGETDEIQNKPI